MTFPSFFVLNFVFYRLKFFPPRKDSLSSLKFSLGRCLPSLLSYPIPGNRFDTITGDPPSPLFFLFQRRWSFRRFHGIPPPPTPPPFSPDSIEMIMPFSFFFRQLSKLSLPEALPMTFLYLPYINRRPAWHIVAPFPHAFYYTSSVE